MYHVIPVDYQEPTPDTVSAHIPNIVALDLEDAIYEFNQSALAASSLLTIDLDIASRTLEYLSDQTMLDYGIATMCDEMLSTFVISDRLEEGHGVCQALKVFAQHMSSELEKMGCYLPNGALPFKVKQVSEDIHVILTRNLEYV